MEPCPAPGPRGAPGYRDVLGVPEFRALWATHVTSAVGDQVTRVALASLVLARTGSVALSALVFTVSFLPWLLGGPVLGVLADRYPRRTLMVACDVGRGLLVAAMALPGVPVWSLFVLGTLAALLAPVFEAARGATVPEVLTAEQYPVGQSLAMASLQLAQLTGFALGGVLVSVHPGSAVLVADAATFLLSAGVLRRACTWRPGGGTTRQDGEHAVRAWLRLTGAGAVVVGRSAELRRLLALSCAVAAVVVLPEGVAVAQARTWGVSASAAGLLCAALPAGTAIGAVALGRWVPSSSQLGLVRPLALLACAATAASLLAPGLPVTLALWCLAGVGGSALLPANVSFVQRLAPEVRGRGLSLAQVALQTTQGGALALGGLLAGHVGPLRAVGLGGLTGGVLIVALAARWPATLRTTGAGPQVPAGRAQRRPPAAWPVWLLTAAVLGLAATLWSVAGPFPTDVPGPLHLPWWTLLPLVVAAQAGVVHFQVRRQAQTVTLCHLPIVLGLVCCGPAGFVLARAGGGAVGMALLRGQRGLKLGLNTAAYTLEAVTAVALLHALRGWPLPPAVYVVMVAADLTSFAVVSCAIALFERRLHAARWVRPLAWLLPINLVATSVALLAAATLQQGLGYLPLLVVVLACLLLFYRAYSRLRDRHLDLGRLKDLAASLPALVPDGPELREAVEQVRSMLVAERAELWLPDGSVVLATDGAPPTTEPPGAPDGVPGAHLAPVLAGRPGRRAAWSSLVTSLTYDGGRKEASLVVRERLGEVRLFDRDDDRLLSAVGALVGGALGRGQDRAHALEAASRDPLTGLWTLPEAARRAADLLADGPLCGLLIVDVIGLQDVNDSLGHDAGDRLLQLTATRLQHAAGSGAVLARIGGDELLAVLPPGGPGPAQVVAAVAGTCEVSGLPVELRVRAGFCAWDTAATFQHLLRGAQAALARASATGTRYRLWSPELSVDPSRRLRLGSDLQVALLSGQVFVVFQPLCRASDEVAVGAEALVRWQHPTQGRIPPDEFVAIAEQTGLVTELTRVVLDAALQQGRRWRDQGHDLRVSVNLSPRSLDEDDLVGMVRSALAEHGLPPRALLLEITENSLMHDIDRGLRVLAQLRDLGVEIALDDFGTGHSSLAHLRDIPAAEVKLDRSLLADLGKDLTAQKIVRTAIMLCHDLGKSVVAEGVEDAEAVRLLRECGVDLLQGYHLGLPLPAAEWDDRLFGAPPVAALPRQTDALVRGS